MAFIYLCGYLINSIYVRSLGIENGSIVKAHFLEAGATFLILTFALMFVPVSMFAAATAAQLEGRFQIRGPKRTAFTVILYCLVLLLFALFITRYEWETRTFFFGVHVKNIFFGYVVVVLLGMVAATELEHFYNFCKDHALKRGWNPSKFARRDLLFGFAMGGLRWFLLAFSLSCIACIFPRIRWLSSMWEPCRYYLFFVAILSFIVYRVHRSLRFAQDRASYVRLLLLSGVFVVCVFYLTLTSYAYSVYRFIPVSRGGRLPVVQAVLTLPADKQAFYPGLVQTNAGSCVFTFPLYLVDESDECVHATTNFTLGSNMDFGAVHFVKRSDIVTMTFHAVDLRGGIVTDVPAIVVRTAAADRK